MAKTLAELEQDVATLKLYFSIAWKIATALGFSVAGLALWLSHEQNKLSDLHNQINQLDPVVKADQDC